MPSLAYQSVRRAILERQIVIASYKGYRREMCPHVIGYKDGIEHALFFQFAGGSSKGLRQGGEWRCIELAELSEISVQLGPWHTGGSHSGRQTCVDQVDLTVSP